MRKHFSLCVALLTMMSCNDPEYVSNTFMIENRTDVHVDCHAHIYNDYSTSVCLQPGERKAFHHAEGPRGIYMVDRIFNSLSVIADTLQLHLWEEFTDPNYWVDQQENTAYGQTYDTQKDTCTFVLTGEMLRQRAEKH